MIDAHSEPAGLVGEQAFDWPARPLAAGGMAVVFQARDRRLPRDVILKTPRTHDNDGRPLDREMVSQFEDRLQAEALVLAKLQHPSIVTIHELGRGGDGAPFCVLERVEGRQLRDLLEELRELEESTGVRRTRERIELLSNLQAVAEALACAHEHNIVHRDCTPNNILIGPRGEATLIDWGLAKDLGPDGGRFGHGTLPAMPMDQAVGDGTATIVAGTPPYVSLEQALGKAAHPAYDVYSFGATLYHVVNGSPPFGEETAVSFLARLVNGETPPPADPRDPELSGIIARAMALDIGARFTATELLRAMKEYLHGDLVFSHRYSRTGRAARWVRKNKWKAALVTVVVVAAVLAAVGWSVVSERTERVKRRAAEARSQAAARVLAAEQKAREEARRTAAAEKASASALATAAEKDAEAEAAQKEADQADKTSKRYQELQGIAEKKRQEADAARKSADDLAKEAQARAAEAKTAAEKAQRDAEQVQRVAEASVSASSRERDEAIAERRRAEQERDAALGDRTRAEEERDSALASRQAAEIEREELRRRVRDLEQQLRERPPAGGGGSGGGGVNDGTPRPPPDASILE
ncbi:MAG TPA: protein kinase [Kofleriaceae bacterium]|nr:protein kinase [Kofleriaceae bacterium]